MGKLLLKHYSQVTDKHPASGMLTPLYTSTGWTEEL